MTIQKWFGTVEDFVSPLIEYLTPLETDSSIRDVYNKIHNGRIYGWLNSSYGKDNINKFIMAADKIGFENLINELAYKNVKTLGRFSKILDDILDNSYNIL